YVALDTIDQNGGQQTEEERGRAKFKSLFPGVYVTMTLDGSYQNLRHFINDIERGNEFIVISSIELEPSDSEGHQQDATGSQNQTTAGGQFPVGRSLSPNTPNFPSGPINPASNRPMTQPQRMQQQQMQPQQTTPRGKTHGETVSLRLELAAYFQR